MTAKKQRITYPELTVTVKVTSSRMKEIIDRYVKSRMQDWEIGLAEVQQSQISAVKQKLASSVKFRTSIVRQIRSIPVTAISGYTCSISFVDSLDDGGILETLHKRLRKLYDAERLSVSLRDAEIIQFLESRGYKVTGNGF